MLLFWPQKLDITTGPAAVTTASVRPVIIRNSINNNSVESSCLKRATVSEKKLPRDMTCYVIATRDATYRARSGMRAVDRISLTATLNVNMLLL